jgi:hypothetical protein
MDISIKDEPSIASKKFDQIFNFLLDEKASGKEVEKIEEKRSSKKPPPPTEETNPEPPSISTNRLGTRYSEPVDSSDLENIAKLSAMISDLEKTHPVSRPRSIVVSKNKEKFIPVFHPLSLSPPDRERFATSLPERTAHRPPKLQLTSSLDSSRQERMLFLSHCFCFVSFRFVFFWLLMHFCVPFFPKYVLISYSFVWEWKQEEEYEKTTENTDLPNLKVKFTSEEGGDEEEDHTETQRRQKISEQVTKKVRRLISKKDLHAPENYRPKSPILLGGDKKERRLTLKQKKV